ACRRSARLQGLPQQAPRSVRARRSPQPAGGDEGVVKYETLSVRGPQSNVQSPSKVQRPSSVRRPSLGPACVQSLDFVQGPRNARTPDQPRTLDGLRTQDGPRTEDGLWTVDPGPWTDLMPAVASYTT